ncbi:MAG: TonB-dependent receptor [Geminicoccaceae bacterium]
MSQIVNGLALATAGVFGASAALAQEPPLRLDPILVDGTSDVGGVYVSEEALDLRAPDDMQDLFTGETVISSGGAIPSASKTFVHGIEESQLNVTVDGARLTAGPFHHSSNTLFDPTLLKAVRVSPGVAAADTGPRALAGTIQFETKDARDLVEEGRVVGGFGRLAYDTNASTFRQNLSLYGRPGNYEYLVYGNHANGSDFEDGSSNRLNGTEADFLSMLAKGAYTSDDRKRIEISASRAIDDAPRQIRPNFGGIVGQATTLADYETSNNAFAISFRDEDISGLYAPELVFAYNNIRIDNDARRGETETFNGKAQNVFSFDLGTVNAGIDFLADEAEGGTKPFTANEKSRNVGLFTQARLGVTDKLSLSFGGRGDYQWFEGQDGSDFDEGGLSGNVSAQYDLLDWLMLEAGYSHVWGGFGLGEASIINAQAPWTYDGMDPADSDNVRIGTLTRWPTELGELTAGIAVFHTEISGAQELNNVNRATNVDLQSQGIDASLGFFFNRGYLQTKYTFADVEQDGDTPSTTNDYLGLPVGHVMAISGAVNAFEGLTLGVTSEIAFENDDTDGMLDVRGGPVGSLDSYEVVNLFAEYVPPQFGNLSLRLEVNNVFDETYLLRSSNGGGQDELIVPLNEPGRSFQLAAKLTF